MFSDPLVLLFAAFAFGVLAIPIIGRLMSGAKLAFISMGGPIALFILLPILNAPFEKTEVLGVGLTGLLLIFGGAFCLASTVAALRKGDRA